MEDDTTPTGRATDLVGLHVGQVEELRARGNAHHNGEMSPTADLCTRAADLLTSQAEEIKRLREAIRPFRDLAVETTAEGSPDYREWIGQSQDWMVIFSFGGRSISLGHLRALAALALPPEGGKPGQDALSSDEGEGS